MSHSRYIIIRLSLSCLLLTALISGCSGVDRSINKIVQAREARKRIEAIPLCPKSTFPIQKIKIAPTEFKPGFNSIHIFHSVADLATRNEPITPEKVFEPSLEILKNKGYQVDLAYAVDINQYKPFIECRHCGNLAIIGVKRNAHFDRETADKDCLYVNNDYTKFFKLLIQKFPQTENYQAIAYIYTTDPSNITDRSKHLHMLLFDRQKQILILESEIFESALEDKHYPPSGYSFSGHQTPDPKTESRLTTAHRGLDKMVSVFPNISGKIIPEKKSEPLRKVYSYQYFIGTQPPQKTELEWHDSKPDFMTFIY